MTSNISTATPSPTPGAAERFSWLGGRADRARDFPYYRGVPVAISGRQWLYVVAMVVVAFLVLASSTRWPLGAAWAFVPAVLLPELPLAALAWVAPGHWTAIFGRVGVREIRLMIGFALLNIVVTIAVGTLVGALTTVSGNSSAAELGNLDTAGRIAFFAKTIPQLFGEEVITLLPFLALLHLFVNVLGTGRKAAIIGAWLITALAFGLLHLPTYGWNVVQCIAIIGTARLVLTLPWLLTKNIWVSTGAHIINDWLLFGMGLIGAGLAGKG